MPWEGDGGEGKYKYHPGGDPKAGVRDAPSALNSSIVPEMNLPKVRIAIALLYQYIGLLFESQDANSYPVPPRRVQQIREGVNTPIWDS